LRSVRRLEPYGQLATFVPPLFAIQLAHVRPSVDKYELDAQSQHVLPWSVRQQSRPPHDAAWLP
jgi:hypothetical protein